MIILGSMIKVRRWRAGNFRLLGMPIMMGKSGAFSLNIMGRELTNLKIVHEATLSDHAGKRGS